MSYTESGVRLRQRGFPTSVLYKVALVASLIANVMLALGLWNHDWTTTAIAKVQTTLAFLN